MVVLVTVVVVLFAAEYKFEVASAWARGPQEAVVVVISPSPSPSTRPGELVRGDFTAFVDKICAPGFIRDLKHPMPNFQCAPVIEKTLELFPILPGIVVEAGVWQAMSTRTIANVLTNHTLYGFDSFVGLPEDWVREDITVTTAFFNKGGNLPGVPDNVKLIKGWFNETLPPFVKEHGHEVLALLHVDCDLYSSAKTVLAEVGHMLRPGSVVIFDDMFNYPGFEKDELKAMFEYFSQTDWHIEWLGKQYGIVRHPTKDEGYWMQSAALRVW